MRSALHSPSSMATLVLTQCGDVSSEEVTSTHEYDGCSECKAKRKRNAELFSSQRRRRPMPVPTTNLAAGLEHLGLSDSDWLGGDAEVYEHEHHKVSVTDWLGRPAGSEASEVFHSHDHPPATRKDQHHRQAA